MHLLYIHITQNISVPAGYQHNYLMPPLFIHVYRLPSWSILRALPTA